MWRNSLPRIGLAVVVVVGVLRGDGVGVGVNEHLKSEIISRRKRYIGMKLSGMWVMRVTLL